MSSATTTPASPTIDTRGMVLIHRVIRREFGLLPGLVRTANGDRPRTQRLATHGAEMLDFLHTHHSGEDELVWPLLRARATLDGELIDQMQTQHEQVAAAISSLRHDFVSWSSSADAATGERIASTIESMNANLDDHLAQEEQRILPLVSTIFSQAEWDALARHGFSAIPGKRRLVMLGHILEESDPDERAHMLQKVPPPARLAFALFGKRQFAREVAAIRG